MFRDATGSWSDNKFQPLVAGFFNLIVNIILVNYIGIYGIIISSVLSMILVDIPWESKTFFRKIFNINASSYYKKIFKIFIVFIFTLLSSYCICYFINLNSILNLVIKFIVSMIIMNIIFYIVYKNTYEYNYLKNIIINLICKIFKKKVLKWK